MNNVSYFNPAYENQYLESDGFDGEGDFEDLETLMENYEGGLYEEPEVTFEDQELWEQEDQEGDQFLGGLGKIFRIAKPFLRKVVPQLAATVGKQIGGNKGAQLAQTIASNVLREVAMEGDHELDHEGDPEADMEALGVNPELMAEMAHYAELAAETESEEEADQFFGAIANLAGQILPGLLGETDPEGAYEGAYESSYESVYEEEGDQFLPLAALAAPLVGKAVAALGKKAIGTGIRTVGRFFRRNRRTRRLVPTLPRIALRATRRVANTINSAARTRRPIPAPVLRRAVTASVARPIAQTLASPARVQTALARNRALARRFRVSGTLTMRPIRRRRAIYR